MVRVEFLSAADDFLTHAIMDQAVFDHAGRATGKMDSNPASLIKISEADKRFFQELISELRESTVTDKDAVDQFCERPSAKVFLSKWPRQDTAFKIHVKRYIVAMSYESGLAFHETDRYTKRLATAIYPTPSPTPPPIASTSAVVDNPAPPPFIDVAVFATRLFKKGETIELQGGTAPLSEEQDNLFRKESNKVDFSVIWSARLNCFALLLGPARFVNHDCRSNVEFIHNGKSMSFKVIEDIHPDEQLFTNYGDSYFDDDNATCLCSTCEQYQRGAFKVVDPNALLVISLRQPKASTSAARISGGPGSSSSSRLSSPALRDFRRSDRVTLDVVKPRLVHPHLKPSVSYGPEYSWNEEERTFMHTMDLSPSPSPSRSPSPPPRKRPRTLPTVKTTTNYSGRPTEPSVIFRRKAGVGRTSSRISESCDKIDSGVMDAAGNKTVVKSEGTRALTAIKDRWTYVEYWDSDAESEEDEEAGEEAGESVVGVKAEVQQQEDEDEEDEEEEEGEEEEEEEEEVRRKPVMRGRGRPSLASSTRRRSSRPRTTPLASTSRTNLSGSSPVTSSRATRRSAPLRHLPISEVCSASASVVGGFDRKRKRYVSSKRKRAF